ncbi:unnamed protein product [Calypogeia fissa]
MTKRKRLGGKDRSLSSSSTTAVARKETAAAPVLNSNWLKLQTTLGNTRKGPNARKRIKAETTGATDKLDGAPSSLLPTSADDSVTRVLALDCEMVGVGSDGKRNALARVSIVNIWGNIVYDKHVRPPERVTDFRTQVSGVRAGDLRKAEDFFTVQKEVADILQNRILVGHALHNDLKVLLLSHPRKNIRDTQHYGPFRSDNGRPQALKHLAALHLGAKIQQREHDSVEDARAALCLYKLFEKAWEENLKQRRKISRNPQTATDTPAKEKFRVG